MGSSVAAEYIGVNINNKKTTMTKEILVERVTVTELLGYYCHVHVR